MVRKYIGENYDSIIEIAKVITKGHAPDFEDLAHEVILMVLEADEEKMARIIEKKQMRFWIIRLCINNYRIPHMGIREGLDIKVSPAGGTQQLFVISMCIASVVQCVMFNALCPMSG